MTKLEEVAMALCMSRHGGYPVDAAARMKNSESWKACWWWQAERDARAALAALREPSEGMVQAAIDADLDIYWGYWADGNEGGPEGVWRAMIDAALTEERAGE